MGSLDSAIAPIRDRTRLAAPQVFDVLRDRIISLQLPPGTVLSRAELQAELGLSSTPIRDALTRLAEESLVDIFPQHATRVSLIDLDLARQAQFLRRSVELEMVATLAGKPADPRLIAQLRGSLQLQQALAQVNDLTRFSDADQSFHRHMYEAAGIPDLWHLVRRQSGHIDRLRRLHLPMEGKARQIIRDHTAIVDAIAAGDPAGAQRELRDHLSRSLAFSTEIRARHPDYFRGE